MSWIHILREACLDIVFPSFCLSCRRYGSWCCQECQAQIERFSRNVCPACGRVQAKHTCPAGVVPLDGLVVTGPYHDPILRSMITGLKYHGVTRLTSCITEYLKDWRDDRIDPWPWAEEMEIGLQPVPATPKRVRARGFDQAELIADIAHETVLMWGNVIHGLVRLEGVETQATLHDQRLRQANVRGMFLPDLDIRFPKSIVLIDDVFTSGATMHEAARVLRCVGVEKVYGFALAVGR